MGLTKSFLVVDDSSTMRQLIVMTLKKLGCTQIADADNGQAALEKISAAMPDIVLTDIDMPVMTGLEFIEQARPKYPALPIVILSTHGDTTTIDKGMQLGANGYLTKPLSGSKLTELLEELFPDLDL